MILLNLTGDESSQQYQQLSISNLNRQYDFLRSIVSSAIDNDVSSMLRRALRIFSPKIIKSLNFHATTCLHEHAGIYRPIQVYVGPHTPAEPREVPQLMAEFIDEVNSNWDHYDPLVLASYVLWRLNYIHPFENGNGRTARAMSYFVLCVKFGFWLPGQIILPELISRNRDRYVLALRQVDDSYKNNSFDISPLHTLLSELLDEQIRGVGRPN